MAATDIEEAPAWLLEETHRLCEAIVALAQHDPTSAPVKPFAALTAAGLLAELTIVRYPMLAVPLAKGFVTFARVLAPNHVEIEELPAAALAAMKETINERANP